MSDKVSSTWERWLVLGIFSTLAGLSQLLWLNFAPLISFIEKKYLVSEDHAGLLLLVFPLIYVLISIPTGRLIDKKGYRYATGLGSLLMTLGTFMRIYEKSFALLLMAQIIISIAQPFIINSISKLVLEWFEKGQEALATGLATMGMFVGMAVGMMATPFLVETIGFTMAMAFFSLISLIATVVFFATMKLKSDREIGIEIPLEPVGVFSLFKNTNLGLIFVLSFLGLGFFNGLTTWIEPILAPRGINSSQSGIIGGILIIGGIVGAAVVPVLSDYSKKRKPYLVGSIFMATLMLKPFCGTGNFQMSLFLAGVVGFFFLPAFSLILEMCAEEGGKDAAGTTTSILMLLGNLGGVVIIIAMEQIKGADGSFIPGVNLLLGVLTLCLLMSLMTKETYKLKS